ncbi:MAG TPA: glycosyltransferase family 2 protein [Candidatus Portnoybacteria bacterium]|nr:glycosyltransferase family 2 protein [Candidatus Portnoybacteria bacterium]
MSNPKVTIIILNWNNWPDTLKCLESIKKINYPNYQVILVDNGSEEKIEVENPKLKVIYNEENLGFTGGNNIGIKEALDRQTDYILLLNNDTIVEPDFLKELVKVGESDSRFGILGPQIYFFNQPQKIWFAGGKLNWLKTKGTHLDLGKVESGHPAPKPKIVDYITGCCLLVKSEVVKKIGLMDEKYFLYYEDTDWNLKAQKAGYLSVLVPQSKIWHKASQSAKEGSANYIYYHSRNGLLLAKNHGPFFIRLMATLGSFWILKKQVAKYLFFPKKRDWAKAVIRGIGDFYLGRFGPV